jgi:hypothetical protein
MQITLDNRKKATVDSPRSAFKRKNRVEERGTSSSRVKKEHESTNLKAQKMMKVRVEPFIIPIVVQVVKQTITIPQMTSHER